MEYFITVNSKPPRRLKVSLQILKYFMSKNTLLGQLIHYDTLCVTCHWVNLILYYFEQIPSLHIK